MVSDLSTIGFRELTSFVEVVRASGITAAADRLGLAKSAVSKHITRLEQQLGVKLLERSSRRISLTQEGAHLVPRIESLLAEGRLLLEQAADAQAAPRGLVRIAATPEYGRFFAQRLLPALLERYPDLQVAMTATYDFEDLQDPAFDLALRIGRVKDDRLVVRSLGRFHRILVAACDHAERHPLTRPEDLEGQRCLVFSGSRTTGAWRFQSVASGDLVRVEVAGPMAMRSFDSVLELAARGLGWAYVPEFIARPGLQSGQLTRGLPDWHSPATPVMLAYRQGASRVRRIGAIIDLTRELAPAWLA